MRYRLILALGVWLFGMLVAQVFVGNLEFVLEAYAESARQRLSRGRGPDPRIVLLGLDEAAMSPEFYHRGTHAKVLENLTKAGAKLVFVDLIFDEDRAPELDSALKSALEKAPPTVLAGATRFLDYDDDKGLRARPPVLAPALESVLDEKHIVLGSIERPPPARGSRWAYFLSLDYGDEELFPSASLAMLSLYQSVAPKDLTYRNGMILVPPLKIPVEFQSDELDGVAKTLFEMKFHRPATGSEHQPGDGTYPVIPYLEMLDPSPELLARFRDKIVVIGENTDSENDAFTTPVGVMKGFEIHAQCFDRLLNGDFYTSVSPQNNELIAVTLVTLIASLALVTWPIPLLLAAGTGLILGYLRLNLWMFDERHLVAALPAPVLGASAAFVALVMVRVILASRFLARFIPVEAARGILMSQKTAEAVDAVVIVTDIRGYTTLSETRTPVEMLHLLNEYHSVTVDIYHKHGGNVLTFQGDAQLVVFGYPKRLKDAAGASVVASVEVMKAIDDLREKWGIKERKNFDVGAGICAGLVYVGDIGSADQANYTVIGEVVRTSHKVQSMSDALEGNVLMDEPAYEACRKKPPVTRIPGVMLEGFPEPKVLYRVEREPAECSEALGGPTATEDKNKDEQTVE